MSSKLKSFSPFSFLPLSLSLPLSFDKCFDVSPLWNNWRSANFAQPIEISIRDRSNLTAPDAITIIYLKLLENNLILFRNPSFPLPPKSTKWKRALSNYSTLYIITLIRSSSCFILLKLANIEHRSYRFIARIFASARTKPLKSVLITGRWNNIFPIKKFKGLRSSYRKKVWRTFDKDEKKKIN